MSWVAVAVGGATLVGTAYTADKQSKAQKKALRQAERQGDYAGAYNTALETQLEALPKLLDAQREWGPQFEQIDLDSQKRTSDSLAQIALEIEKKYGPAYLDQYLDRLERVDPEGQAARRQLAGMVMTDAAAGGKLGADERREVQQAVRGGQAARGNILGDAAAFEEAMETGFASRQRLQERMGSLQNFLAMPSPQQSMPLLSGGAPGAAPFMPLQQAAVVNPDGAVSGIQHQAGQMFQAKMNMPNPWMEGVGMMAGMAGQLGGAYIANKN